MALDLNPPGRSDDPILAALHAEFHNKYAESQRIVGDHTASGDDVKRAHGLAVQLPDIRQRIDARQATLRELDAIKAIHESASAWGRETSSRALPYPGAGGHGPARERHDAWRWPPNQGGRGERYDHVSSPEEKLMMSGGFQNLGHFGYALYKCGRDGRGEPRFVKELADWDAMQTKMVQDFEFKAPMGMFGLSDPDGGLLVPPQFTNQIYERMIDQNQILSRLQPIPATSNVIKLRALKEDSRLDGERGGGITGFWENEADQYQHTKTQFRPVELNLHKLTVFTYVTEELMMDSNIAVDAYIANLASREINFKINAAVVNGTGAGMPLGSLRSGSRLTIDAMPDQEPETIMYPNITAMFAQMTSAQRGSIVWLYGQDSEPQLNQLYQPTGIAGVLVFVPNQSGSAFTLYNRPAMVMEQCPTLGETGDLIGFATDGYVCATKGGLQSFMSMHLRFDFDEFAFKWRFRFDGRPWDEKPLLLYNGSTYVSSIVALAPRRAPVAS